VRLEEAGQQPGADGCWSTEQIAGALFGSLFAQKVKKLAAEADLAVMEAEAMRGESLPRVELVRVLALVVNAMRQIIEHSRLSLEDKNNLFRELSSIPVVVAEVAETQSRALSRRSRRSTNGEEESSNGTEPPGRKAAAKKKSKAVV
jgi:hypothetical protein